MKTLLPIAALLLVFAGAAFAQTPPPLDAGKEADAKALAAMQTEDLISKFQEESDQGIGSHTTAIASGFVAIDDEPRFHGGILGSAKPVTSPVMRELVRRGLAALPALITHLNDARPSKLTVGKGFMGKWFADEYEPRYSDPAKQPAGVNKPAGNPNGAGPFDDYTLKVGDFCYVAVGQIVNRQLNAVRYQPSMCLVVNSPVGTPALAAAVKADWGGLTAAEHQHSLEQDAIYVRNPLTSGEALKRLYFYYPQAGEALIVRILSKPLYDHRGQVHFFYKMLVPAKDAEKRNLLMADYRKNESETNCQAVLGMLLAVSNFPVDQMNDERRKQKKMADELLHRFFPEVDPANPPFINAADIDEQQRLVESLSVLHSQAIDGAVAGILQSDSKLPLDDDSNYIFSVFNLADTCAQHLAAEKEYEKIVRASVEKVIVSMQDARNRVVDPVGKGFVDRDTKVLRELLARLPVKTTDKATGTGRN